MGTRLPPSPFVDPTQIDEQPRFVLDERRFWRDMTGTDDDPPPMFIGAPSAEYMDSIFREIAPTLEAIARR